MNGTSWRILITCSFEVGPASSATNSFSSLSQSPGKPYLDQNLTVCAITIVSACNRQRFRRQDIRTERKHRHTLNSHYVADTDGSNECRDFLSRGVTKVSLVYLFLVY
jgi:hypothetical protein